MFPQNRPEKCFLSGMKTKMVQHKAIALESMKQQIRWNKMKPVQMKVVSHELDSTDVILIDFPQKSQSDRHYNIYWVTLTYSENSPGC